MRKHGKTGKNVEKHETTGGIRGKQKNIRKNRENQGKQKNRGKQGKT